MQGYLKQSTAVTIMLGPFLDSTDGNTQEGALTITQGDVLLSKNGGAFAQKNDATACTVDATQTAYYTCPLNTTDTNTLGILRVVVHETGSLIVDQPYMVVTANVYDTLCSTDAFDVNVASIDNIDFGATMKASINTEVDNALNTAIPGSPTADSINQRVAAVDDLTQASGAGDLAAILLDTGELQTDWANGGRLDLLIDAIKAITDLLTLAAIADAVHDEVTEGTTTLRQAIKLISSALFAKTSGGGTNTLVARDIGDTKNRITLTTDANGNRTASTLDGT